MVRLYEPSARKTKNLPLWDCEQQLDNCDKPLMWIKLIVINILILLKVMTLLGYTPLPPLNPFWPDGDIKLVQLDHTEDSLVGLNHFVIICKLTATQFSFIEKRQKSHGVTSGLYGGCISILTPNFGQKSLVKEALWGRMLSWCKMNIFKIAEHFRRTCSYNFCSTFTHNTGVLRSHIE